MAKIPVIFEPGRADGKLAESKAIYDSILKQFQSDINGEYKLTKKQVEFLTPIIERLNDVQDTLTSIDTDKPLSAKQGKILKELLDAKVIEVNAVPMDSEPTEGNTEHVVTSDGINKALNKKVDINTFVEKNKNQDEKFFELEDGMSNIKDTINGRYIPNIHTLVSASTDVITVGSSRYSSAAIYDKPEYEKKYLYTFLAVDGFDGIIKRIAFASDGSGKLIYTGNFNLNNDNPLEVIYECATGDTVSVNHNILSDCAVSGKILCKRELLVPENGIKQNLELLNDKIDETSKIVNGQMIPDDSTATEADSEVVEIGDDRFYSMYFPIIPEEGKKYQFVLSSVNGFEGSIRKIVFGTDASGDIIFSGLFNITQNIPLVIDYECKSGAKLARNILVNSSCISRGNVKLTRKTYKKIKGINNILESTAEAVDKIENVIGSPYYTYINFSIKTSTAFSQGTNRYINVLFDTEFIAGKSYKLVFKNKGIGGTINSILLGPSGSIETLYNTPFSLTDDAQVFFDCNVGGSKYIVIGLSVDADGTIDVARSEKIITSELKEQVKSNTLNLIDNNSYLNRRKVESVFVRNKSINLNTDFKFGLISDLHATSAARFKKFIDIANKWGADYFDCIINCGDTVDGTMNESLLWYDEIVDSSAIDILTAVGNHDAWTNTSPITLGNPVDGYNLITSKVASKINNIVQPNNPSSGKCYYYKDYNSKIRIIVIDIMWWNSEEELWLTESLNDANSKGLAVLIITHANFKKEYYRTIECSFTYPMDIGEDSIYTPIVAATIVKAFIDNGGDFICWVAGHAHMNIISKLPDYGNQVIIQTTSMNARGNKDTLLSNIVDDYNYFCAEHIGIDIDNSLLKIMRLGSDITPLGQRRDILCVDYKKAIVIE